MLPKDPMGVFWLRQKDFDQMVEQKAKNYGKSSTEKKYLDVLVSVMDKNSKMFKRIWSYANIFQSYAVILCQIEITVRNETKLFPYTQELDELEEYKKEFEKKLIELLNLLSPSYERVEHLYRLLDGMNAKTKINSNILNHLDYEAAIVNEIYEQFENIFKEFPLEAYRYNISDIRKTTNRLEDGNIKEKRASKKLVDFLEDIDELVPDIEETLDKAKKIEFTKLLTATNLFCSLASRAYK